MIQIIPKGSLKRVSGRKNREKISPEKARKLQRKAMKISARLGKNEQEAFRLLPERMNQRTLDWVTYRKGFGTPKQQAEHIRSMVANLIELSSSAAAAATKAKRENVHWRSEAGKTASATGGYLKLLNQIKGEIAGLGRKYKELTGENLLGKG